MQGTLLANGWGAALGYPGLILEPDGPEVPVHVLVSPDLSAHWPRLDHFEGPGYRRVTTRVETGEGRLESWIYVLVEVPSR